MNTGIIVQTSSIEDHYYMLLTRPAWEHVAAQFLRKTFAAEPYYPTTPDTNKADSIRPTISGYIFAKFPCHEHLNPRGRIPTTEELTRCTSANPRFLMVYVGESKSRARDEPRFYTSEDDEIMKEAMASIRRQRLVPVYEPMTLPHGVVKELQTKLHVNTDKLLDNMIGKIIQLPYGPCLGMRAKIKKITKNTKDLRASICQLFVCEKGIFNGTKVVMTLGEITKS